MLAGFLSGYLAYDCIHCALHARSGTGGGWRLLARLRRHHTAHHYRCRAGAHLRASGASLTAHCSVLASSVFIPWVPSGRASDASLGRHAGSVWRSLMARSWADYLWVSNVRSCMRC